MIPYSEIIKGTILTFTSSEEVTIETWVVDYEGIPYIAVCTWLSQNTGFIPTTIKISAY